MSDEPVSRPLFDLALKYEREITKLQLSAATELTAVKLAAAEELTNTKIAARDGAIKLLADNVKGQKAVYAAVGISILGFLYTLARPYIH